MTFDLTRTSILLAAAFASAAGTANAAEPLELTVTIENLAPRNGTNQTPHWVGFHDGSFDVYDGGTPADSLPAPGSVAVERLANLAPLQGQVQVRALVLESVHLACTERVRVGSVLMGRLGPERRGCGERI